MGVPSENCLAKPEELNFNNLNQLIDYLRSLEQSSQKTGAPVHFHGKILNTGEGYIRALVF